MKRFLMPALLTLTLVLAACSAAATPIPSSPQPGSVANITPTPTDDPAIISTLLPNTGSNTELTRIDQQGMVVVEVTPLNLEDPSDQLEFDVSLNTHSIDLGMDLASLATLAAENAITQQATLWDAPRGGHHVSGKLIFPAIQNGKSILEGASKLTLTIVNLDASSRVFEWDLK